MTKRIRLSVKTPKRPTTNQLRQRDRRRVRKAARRFLRRRELEVREAHRGSIAIGTPVQLGDPQGYTGPATVVSFHATPHPHYIVSLADSREVSVLAPHVREDTNA